MSRADSPLDGRMIFNVGARRSGTFWLQRIVGAHPDVSAVPSETHLFSDGIAPLFERFQHSVRSSTSVGRVYVEREPVVDAARALCDVVFADFLEPGTSRLAERTPLHALHLDLIGAIYPDARFVHIIRDGRDVALSVAAQDWGPETIEDAAREWRATVVAARSASLRDGSYREVRYEDLLEDPQPAIRDLYEWLGLTVDAGIVTEAVAEARTGANLGASPSGIAAAKWRGSYSARELATFDRVAGDLLDELGYPPSAPGTGAHARPRPKRLAKAVAGRLAGIGRDEPSGRDRGAEGDYDQELVDDVVGAVREGAMDRLSELMTEDAVVRVPSASGSQSARGASGLDLLRAALSPDAPRSRLVRSDAYPGTPYAGVVLVQEHPDGGLDHGLLFVRLSGRRVEELVLYRLSART